MDHSRFWSTVTPFSKTLAMIFFIVLPLVTFHLGMKYGVSIVGNIPNSITHTANISTKPINEDDSLKIIDEYKQELALYKTRNIDKQEMIDNLRDKTLYKSTSVKCKKDINIWNSLSKELKDNTTNKGTSEILTYDYTQLAWSDDCTKLPFIIELVGRGGGAYNATHFKPRGLYLYDDGTKKVTPIKLISENSTIDYSQYGSNHWSDDSYIFVISTKKSESEFVNYKYNYDTKSGITSLYVPEWLN